jgi:hypothetical protein
MKFINLFRRRDCHTETGQPMANSHSELMAGEARKPAFGGASRGILLTGCLAVILTAGTYFYGRYEKAQQKRADREYAELKKELESGLLAASGVDMSKLKSIAVQPIEEGCWKVTFELKDGSAITRRARLESGRFVWEKTGRGEEPVEGGTVRRDSVRVGAGGEEVELDSEISSRNGEPINEGELQLVLERLPQMLEKACESAGIARKEMEKVSIVFVANGLWEVTFDSKNGERFVFHINIKDETPEKERKTGVKT